MPAVGLTQEQFGLWAALAIHDMSSVVGAGMKYGAVALSLAITVKLARALWIAPLAFSAAIGRQGLGRIKWPWFILLFVTATLMNTYVPGGAPAYGLLAKLSKIALVVTLFFIGSNISRATLRNVGIRPLLQGGLLWAMIAALSLLLISSGVIHL